MEPGAVRDCLGDEFVVEIDSLDHEVSSAERDVELFFPDDNAGALNRVDEDLFGVDKLLELFGKDACAGKWFSYLVVLLINIDGVSLLGEV